MKTIYLAGGCFWGTQKFLAQFDGVQETETGYANGKTEHPTYEEVCQGSGHAETVRVLYDENVISLTKLLHFYFMAIDPTAVNHQGEDFGEQFRTGIYYDDESLLPEIRAVENETRESLAREGKELAVEVLPLQQFYSAEEYHQDYLAHEELPEALEQCRYW